jgi:hypothetical protein
MSIPGNVILLDLFIVITVTHSSEFTSSQSFVPVLVIIFALGLDSSGHQLMAT